MYADEYIEYWGQVFVARRLRKLLGISFAQFLDSPRAWLRDASFGLHVRSPHECCIEREDINNGYEPLLPAQRASVPHGWGQ
jgi:hypothetical protein